MIWLRYRLGFFIEAACAALARQAGDPPFRWLVFFDERSPAWLREEIGDLAPGLFEPVFASEIFSSSLVSMEVAARSGSPFLITTRLDSDDCVAKRFVWAVQEQFANQNLIYVDFPLGYQMDRSGAIYRYSYPFNAFISLIEERSDAAPKTVFFNPRHGQSLTVAPVREVITTPMWMQIVHGSNLANDIRGRRVSPRRANELYDFDLPYRSKVPTPTLMRETTVQATRLIRMWVGRPFLPKQWVHATRDRIRGTHTKPRSKRSRPI